eukprot:6188576-Pleurochrysis_carterae.AAC.4
MQKECQQALSKEARGLSACDGVSGVELSAVRRGTTSRALASTGKARSRCSSAFAALPGMST